MDISDAGIINGVDPGKADGQVAKLVPEVYLAIVEKHHLLAEDCHLIAFTGSPANAQWLDKSSAEFMFQVTPDKNTLPEHAVTFVRKVVDEFDYLRPHLDQVAHKRGDELLDAHLRVRVAMQAKGVRYRVEPKLPPDILGIYIYLPAE